MNEFIYMRVQLRMYVYMHACVYVCVYVCMFVCMYVCMYVCIHSINHIQLPISARMDDFFFFFEKVSIRTHGELGEKRNK